MADDAHDNVEADETNPLPTAVKAEVEGSDVPASRPNIIQLPGSIVAAGRAAAAAASSAEQQAGTNASPPMSATTSSSGPSTAAPQRMELQDAFAYLDRVKVEFADQPEVYNKFLQIMREFKANTIDANGVIVRVVQLFRGHRTLIHGFNAFLPRTHHIDPAVAETGVLPPHLVQVANSLGIPLNQQGAPLPLVPSAPQTQPLAAPAAVRPPQHPQMYAGAPPPGTWPGASHSAPADGVAGMYYGHGPTAPGMHHMAPPGGQYMSNIHGPPGGAMHHHMAAPGAYVAPGMHAVPGSYAYGRPPVSASAHVSSAGAVPMASGVASSTYQPTMGIPPLTAVPHAPPIVSSGVPASSSITQSQPLPSLAGSDNGRRSSTQFLRAISYVKKIKQRFADAPDTYKTFLAALHSYHREQKSIFEVYMEVAALFSEHPDLLEEFVLFLPEHEAASISSRLAAAAPGTQKRPSDTSLLASVLSTTNDQAVEDVQAPPQDIPLVVPVGRATKRARQAAALATRAAEESAFYERVKRYLGDRQTYAEFLKCLNLFCQDIIRMQDLVQLVHRFIGANEELYTWFKDYIGYKEHQQHNINRMLAAAAAGHMQHASSTGAVGAIGGTGFSQMDVDDSAPGRAVSGVQIVADAAEINLQACRRLGSYRILPRSTILSCSSYRSKIGIEVLNDRMISVPVFSTEDGTFLATKKNIYEEALFRCEDERYEMDLLIEVNLAAISVFEPLARRIALMSDSERSSLTLGNFLGGTSSSIYARAIRKVYGDKADEVLASLQTNTAVSLPVVLARLKQKDEEWRRVQRDWNRVWRDVHAKNYYKALDQHGIDFKATDRRATSGRVLLADLEAAVLEQRNAAARGDSRDIQSQPHYEQSVKVSPKSASDLARVVRAYVREAAGFASNDRKAVSRFLTSFISAFFGIAIGRGDSEKESVQSSAEVKAEDATASHPLEFDFARKTADAMDVDECAPSPTIEMNIDQPAGLVTESATGNQDGKSVVFFANGNLYVLVRLLTMALERLERVRLASDAANGKPYFAEKKNVVAAFMEAQPAPESQQPAPGELDGGFYAAAMALLKRFVCGSLDATTFEERMRFMFGMDAYHLFTFDRLVMLLVKQVQLVLMDSCCEQLVRIFDSWNASGKSADSGPSMQSFNTPLMAYSLRAPGVRMSEYAARMAAEAAIPARDTVVRIEFGTGRMTARVLDRLAPSSATAIAMGFTGNGTPGEEPLPNSAESRWAAYVDTFVRLESAPQFLKPDARVFLARNRRAVEDAERKASAKTGSAAVGHAGMLGSVAPAAVLPSRGRGRGAGRGGMGVRGMRGRGRGGYGRGASLASLRSAPTRAAAGASGGSLQVQYNLECKIAVNTYKLFYVENTEDFMCRLRNTRTAKFSPRAAISRRSSDSSVSGDERRTVMSSDTAESSEDEYHSNACTDASDAGLLERHEQSVRRHRDRFEAWLSALDS